MDPLRIFKFAKKILGRNRFFAKNGIKIQCENKKQLKLVKITKNAIKKKRRGAEKKRKKLKIIVRFAFFFALLNEKNDRKFKTFEF